MSHIDVLDILEEVCAGDDDKHIGILLAYIDELEDGVGMIDKMSSLYGDKAIIRALEGYASFLQLLFEVEHEDENEEDEVLSTDQRRDIVDNRTSSDYDSYQDLRYRDSRGYEYDKFDTAFLSECQKKHSRGFENSIKGTDYAYGGFMSEDDD